MEKDRTGICKLCLQEKYLLKESHIFSAFLYREAGLLNDEKYAIVETKKLIEGTYVDGFPKANPKSKGEFEGGILCESCDNKIIGTYETYASQLLFHNSNCKQYQTGEGFKFSLCTNVDYTKFKLFVLSLLWRASISSRKAFGNVRLNSAVAEELRLMILNSDAKEFSKFPFLIYTHWNIDESEMPSDLFIPPIQMISPQGEMTYRFYMGGNFYDIFLGKINPDLSPFVLNQEGELRIFHLQKYQADIMIKKIIEG